MPHSNSVTLSTRSFEGGAIMVSLLKVLPFCLSIYQLGLPRTTKDYQAMAVESTVLIRRHRLPFGFSLKLLSTLDEGRCQLLSI